MIILSLGTRLWFGATSFFVWWEYAIVATCLCLLCVAWQTVLSPSCWSLSTYDGLSQRYPLTISLTFLDVKHPAMDMLRHNFGSYVAEVIELANRGLSHTSGRKRGRTEVFRNFVFQLEIFLAGIIGSQLPSPWCDDATESKFQRGDFETSLSQGFHCKQQASRIWPRWRRSYQGTWLICIWTCYNIGLWIFLKVVKRVYNWHVH